MSSEDEELLDYMRLAVMVSMGDGQTATTLERVLDLIDRQQAEIARLHSVLRQAA